MRLITHNMLTCNKKGVENGFPLKLQADEIEKVEIEFNPEFILKMLPKLDWNAFLEGAKALNVEENLPSTIPEDIENDEDTLKFIHHALLEVHVKQGTLTCPESGRVFPITDSIPNMLLREDEV